MWFISRHITPLVIYSIGGGHTHTHTHMHTYTHMHKHTHTHTHTHTPTICKESISRNQVHKAGMHLV